MNMPERLRQHERHYAHRPRINHRFSDTTTPLAIAALHLTVLGAIFLIIADPSPALPNRQFLSPSPAPAIENRVLVPLPFGQRVCPDGSLPVVNKNNAFCTQPQLTPVATPR